MAKFSIFFFLLFSSNVFAEKTQLNIANQQQDLTQPSEINNSIILTNDETSSQPNNIEIKQQVNQQGLKETDQSVKKIKSADFIMQKIQKNLKLKTAKKYKIFMQVKKSNGVEKKSYIEFYEKIDYNSVKSIYKFIKPRDVKDTALLNVASIYDDNVEQWLYLPAIKTLREISDEYKNQAMLFSDFTYHDLAYKSIYIAKHELVKETAGYYVVKSTPKTPINSYQFYVSLISKENYVPLLIEYYNKQLKIFKTLEQKEIKSDGDYFYPTVKILTSKENNNQTTMQIVESDFSIYLNDSFFTKSSLKNIN